MSYEFDVAQHLASQYAELVYQENVFTGWVRAVTPRQGVPGAVPSEAVFCLGTGGLPDIPFWGTAARESKPTVQITVRSDRKRYEDGLALATLVYGGINLNPPPGYIDARAEGSAPELLPEDDQNDYRWVINVTLIKIEGE